MPYPADKWNYIHERAIPRIWHNQAHKNEEKCSLIQTVRLAQLNCDVIAFITKITLMAIFPA